MQAEVSLKDFDADKVVIYGRHRPGGALVVAFWAAIFSLTMKLDVINYLSFVCFFSVISHSD